MIETQIRDYLISKISSLSASNCFVGCEPSGYTGPIFTVVKTELSPLSDSHNMLATKITIPKGIKQKGLSMTISVKSTTYDTGSNLIEDIFSKLGGSDGGCIIQNTTQMYITPVEAPYYDYNIFVLNFIVRTNSV